MRHALYAPMSLPVALGLVLGACQSNSRDRDVAYVERPVAQLYTRGAGELDKNDYEEAILLFNEVERQHPYSEWARRAAVMTAFAHYRGREYDEAVSVADNYISLNPGTRGAAYAYYIKAISYFEQIMDVGRDQKMTVNARDALVEVIRRYPESEYAKDAKLKLDMVNDQLAGKNMDVGRWYLRRNEHIAAINRFRTVVEDYQTTSHTPEALHRLVEAYLSLGLRGEAQAVGAVLGHNFPDSDWYRDSYGLLVDEGLDPDAVDGEQRRGWLSRIF
jgi:outer membrane protein assembly factor BamD